MRQASTAERIAPKPIPKHPYDQGALADYAFDKVSVHVKHDDQSFTIERRIAEWLWRQPAWVQVLLVENRVTFEVGARKKTGLSRDAAASAEPTKYHIQRMMGQMQDLEADLSHEVGHIIDAILMDQMQPRSGSVRMDQEFYSSASLAYKRALSHDRALPATRSRRDVTRGLKQHLASKVYKPEEYPCESFAYVFEMYLMEHHKGKSEEQIDERMMQYLPKVWPQFRDKMLPELLHIAGDMYEQRRTHQQRRAQAQFDDLEQAMHEAMAQWDMPPLREPFVLKQLSGGDRQELWMDRFQQLSQGLPKDPYKRIYALFGLRYESMDAMMDALHENPALKREARRMVMQLEDTLAKDGIDGFVKACIGVDNAMEWSQRQEQQGWAR